MRITTRKSKGPGGLARITWTPDYELCVDGLRIGNIAPLRAGGWYYYATVNNRSVNTANQPKPTFEEAKKHAIEWVRYCLGI